MEVAPPGPNACNLVPVEVGGVWFAIDASLIREVLGPCAWVQLPRPRPELPGPMAWRGRAIAVLDLGQFTGVAKPLSPGERRRRTLVVETRSSCRRCCGGSPGRVRSGGWPYCPMPSRSSCSMPRH